MSVNCAVYCNYVPLLLNKVCVQRSSHHHHLLHKVILMIFSSASFSTYAEDGDGG